MEPVISVDVLPELDAAKIHQLLESKAMANCMQRDHRSMRVPREAEPQLDHHLALKDRMTRCLREISGESLVSPVAEVEGFQHQVGLQVRSAPEHSEEDETEDRDDSAEEDAVEEAESDEAADREDEDSNESNPEEARKSNNQLIPLPGKRPIIKKDQFANEPEPVKFQEPVAAEPSDAIVINSESFKPMDEPVKTIEQIAEPAVEPVHSMVEVAHGSDDHMVEPATQTIVIPAAEPVAEPSAEPVAEPSAEPVNVPAAETPAEPSAESIVVSDAVPVAEPVAEPEAPAEPLTAFLVASGAVPVAEPVAVPATEQVAEMVVRPENKPLVNLEIKPVAEPEAQPDLKPIAQSVSDQKDTMESYHFADQPSKLSIKPVEKQSVSSLCPSIDFCVIGKLYTAAQGAIARQCKGCAAYVQCLGSQQATSMCRNDPVDGALDDDSASDEGSDESSEKVKKAVARQGLPVDAISESVKTVTRSDEWKNYLENTIGVKVNHEANRHGRLGRNCYALYGMFRGCLMPSLCLGYSNV